MGHHVVNKCHPLDGGIFGYTYPEQVVWLADEYPGVSRAVHELIPAAQHFQTHESIIWWTEAA